MCFGPELAAVMAAVSAGTGYMASKKIANERDDIRNYYQARNEINRKKAMEQTAGAVGEYEAPSFAEKLAEARENRAGIAEHSDQVNFEDVYQGSAPDSLKRDIGRKIIEEVDYGKEQAQLADKLNAITDAMYGNKLDVTDYGAKVGMYGDFSRGNANAGQLESQMAVTKGDALNTVSDLAGAAGSLSNVYYATGMPNQGGFAAPWTPRATGMPTFNPNDWMPTGSLGKVATRIR